MKVGSKRGRKNGDHTTLGLCVNSVLARRFMEGTEPELRDRGEAGNEEGDEEGKPF
jgi:hypothetical protein